MRRRDGLPEVLGHGGAGLLGRLTITTRLELDVDGDSGALIQGACNVHVSSKMRPDGPCP